MQRSKRMQVVLQLAQQAEDKAAQELGRYQQQLTEEQEQLQSIQNYNGDYLAKIQQQRSGLRAEEIMSSRNFLKQLGDLEQAQLNKIASMEHSLGQYRLQWQQCHHRRQSIVDLIARLSQEENALLEKKLQKELDDLACQKFTRDQ